MLGISVPRWLQVTIRSAKRDDLGAPDAVEVGRGERLEAIVGPAEGEASLSELCRGSLHCYSAGPATS